MEDNSGVNLRLRGKGRKFTAAERGEGGSQFQADEGLIVGDQQHEELDKIVSGSGDDQESGSGEESYNEDEEEQHQQKVEQAQAMDMISSSSSSSTSSRSELITTQNELISRKTVCIVVLGDIGRSPRMRYHALSLAREGFFVRIVGYGGSSIPKELESNPAIWLKYMREPPDVIQQFPRLISYPLKIVWQWLFLSWAFIVMTFLYQFHPDFILLQNPPAIPTIPICWWYAKVYNCQFIIDWHNYGYSIMAMKTGVKSPIYKLAKWLEDFFGKRADAHICVTRAMKDDLRERLGVNAVTLYDRPPSQFKPFTPKERLEFLTRFSATYPEVRNVISSKPGGEMRPGILVSTTSWTEDEDFRILLTALKEYDRAATLHSSSFPPLLVFITGKGPEKEYYKNIIDKMQVTKVKIFLPWLEHEDYPKLLACADLGVSLHTSSSGLDLPMKVVDMFGAGLPVCAFNFKCISELVKHNENGLIFNNAPELALQIQDWFKLTKDKLPNEKHVQFRENLKEFQSLRWHPNWIFNAASLFES